MVDKKVLLEHVGSCADNYLCFLKCGMDKLSLWNLLQLYLFWRLSTHVKSESQVSNPLLCEGDPESHEYDSFRHCTLLIFI